MKLQAEELQRYAKEADAKAKADESTRLAPPRRRSSRPKPRPTSEPEIEVTVELAELASIPPESGEEPPEGHKTVPPPLAESDFRVARGGAGWPNMESVPVVVASREDLSWFELDEQAELLLAMIDGESTVGAILENLSMPRFDALALFHELEAHHVVAFR
jgi:hypothetical protein